jgi:hypothetical protein
MYFQEDLRGTAVLSLFIRLVLYALAIALIVAVVGIWAVASVLGWLAHLVVAWRRGDALPAYRFPTGRHDAGFARTAITAVPLVIVLIVIGSSGGGDGSSSPSSGAENASSSTPASAIGASTHERHHRHPVDHHRRAHHHRSHAAPRAKQSPAQSPASNSSCDSNYQGACLDPNASDYDCLGGSGNGPEYAGPVRVVGIDHYDLDRDGDGYACEPS